MVYKKSNNNFFKIFNIWCEKWKLKRNTIFTLYINKKIKTYLLSKIKTIKTAELKNQNIFVV